MINSKSIQALIESETSVKELEEQINEGFSEFERALVSMSEQLRSFYEDMQYLEEHFPDYNIRKLVDLAKRLKEEKEEEKAKQQDMSNVIPIAKLKVVPTYAPSEQHKQSIIPVEVFKKLGSLTQVEADQYNVGIIEVDDDGIILLYNQYEQDLAGVTLVEAKGKSFFTDIAPCTANRYFKDRFKNGLKAGRLDVDFEYTFTYKLDPTPVHVHLYKHQNSGKNYIFVKKTSD